MKTITEAANARDRRGVGGGGSVRSSAKKRPMSSVTIGAASTPPGSNVSSPTSTPRAMRRHTQSSTSTTPHYPQRKIEYKHKDRNKDKDITQVVAHKKNLDSMRNVPLDEWGPVDIIKLIKSNYRRQLAREPVPEIRAKLTSRNLQRFGYVTDVSHLDENELWSEKYTRKQKMLKAGHHTVAHEPYRELGDVTLESNVIMVNNLANCLPEWIRNMKVSNKYAEPDKKSRKEGDAEKKNTVDEEINQHKRGREADTQTAGMNLIKRMLRETNDRMTATKGGESFMTHAHKCQAQRDAEKSEESEVGRMLISRLSQTTLEQLITNLNQGVKLKKCKKSERPTAGGGGDGKSPRKLDPDALQSKEACRASCVDLPSRAANQPERIDEDDMLKQPLMLGAASRVALETASMSNLEPREKRMSESLIITSPSTMHMKGRAPTPTLAGIKGSRNKLAVGSMHGKVDKDGRRMSNIPTKYQTLIALGEQLNVPISVDEAEQMAQDIELMQEIQALEAEEEEKADGAIRTISIPNKQGNRKLKAYNAFAKIKRKMQEQRAQRAVRFIEKLDYLYIILCSLHNFKSRFLKTKNPLSMDVLKALRRDPFAKSDDDWGSRKKPIRMSFNDACVTRNDSVASQMGVCNPHSRLQKRASQQSRLSCSNHQHSVSSAKMNTLTPLGGGAGGRRKSRHLTGLNRDNSAPAKLETWEEFLTAGVKSRLVRALRHKPLPWQIPIDGSAKEPQPNENEDEDGDPQQQQQNPQPQQPQKKALLKDHGYNPYKCLSNIRNDFKEMKKRQNIETQIAIDRIERERQSTFEATLKHIDSMLRNNVLLVKTLLKKHDKEMEQEVIETAPWYEALEAEAHNNDIHQDEQVITGLAKLYKFVLGEDLASLSSILEKLCLLVMSLPVYDVCTVPCQLALKFIMTDFLDATPQLLAEWLGFRKLFVVRDLGLEGIRDVSLDELPKPLDAPLVAE